MVVRYRRSADVQRAQMRWIAIAVVIFAGAGLPFVIVRYGLELSYQASYILMSLALLAGCFLPVAAAIAILRHRLYDIDLILNRALVYIPLSAILAGLYTAGVALFAHGSRQSAQRRGLVGHRPCAGAPWHRSTGARGVGPAANCSAPIST